MGGHGDRKGLLLLGLEGDGDAFPADALGDAVDRVGQLVYAVGGELGGAVMALLRGSAPCDRHGEGCPAGVAGDFDLLEFQDVGGVDGAGHGRAAGLRIIKSGGSGFFSQSSRSSLKDSLAILLRVEALKPCESTGSDG